MQFINLKNQFDHIESDVLKRIDTVLRNQKFIMGPEVYELEDNLADYTRSKHVVTCSSGTDALVMAMMALGVGPRDVIFVPSFTFFASAESITLAGGVPVFVDSRVDTFNMCRESLQKAIEAVLREGTLTPKGIMAVNLFGQPADYAAIRTLAAEYGLFVMEDAAQSFGASQHGKISCSLGDVSATSFYPSKPLGCYGDGGAVFTDNDDIAFQLRSIRVHGQGVDKYDNVRIGLNARLDSIQAAVLLSKLNVFDSELTARTQIAEMYSSLLKEYVRVPYVEKENVSSWAQYTITCKDNKERAKIVTALKEQGIPTCLFYPIPIHQSKAYRHKEGRGKTLPSSEWLSERVVSLPMHPYLEPEDIDRVAETIESAIT